MDAIRLPDALQRVIEQQVEEGRAASTSAFLEEAVLRLVQDVQAEEDEVRRVVSEGVADIEAGRYTLVATAEDGQALHERIVSRLREKLASDR